LIPSNRRKPQRRAIVGNNEQPGDGFVKLIPAFLYQDANYTTNLCTNPSFETSLAGWNATDGGTTIMQTEVLTNSNGQQVIGQKNALYGKFAMQVTTDGTVFNQGVTGPMGTVPANAGPVIGSMVCSIFGETGTLNVTAVANQGGITIGTTQIVLNGNAWQTITLNNLNMPAGQQVYLLITTAFSQDITFYVDGVMYQPTSPAHQYVDGDQNQCKWTGTAELSTSFQQYQNAISPALLWFQLSGSATFVGLGAAFQLPPADEPLVFTMTPSTGVQLGILNPTVALTDFAIWGTGFQSTTGPGASLLIPDPAQTYGWWTNSGALSGQNTYTRVYGMFAPPLDYPVSNGNYAWRRAAYGAVGFQWLSVPTNQAQILSDVQLELAQTNVHTAITPSAYQRPRQLRGIIKPNRLNYCTNPAMWNNTTGWSGIHGDETLSRTTQNVPTAITNYNNLPFSLVYSLQVQLNSSSSQGCQITINNLEPGETYIFSFWVYPGNQFGDIIGSMGSGSGDLGHLINTQDGYGEPPYGTGPYGGVNAPSAALPSTWARLACSNSNIYEPTGFVATTDTITLQIVATMMPGVTYPETFWITGVVVEPGDILQPYFDGYSGADALWETTGGTTTPVPNQGTTPGAGRSYYYNQLQYGQTIVQQILANNTPLGISAATPLYATPPTQ
jgi:hypothetical protein